MAPLDLKGLLTPATSTMSPPRAAMASRATSDTSFTHESLPDAAKYIRLVEVLDDNYSKTIKVRCRLTTWPIDSVPSYHAISYTWGDPESNTFIFMNDEALEVRTNCEFALKQAYWYWKKQPLWSRGPRLYYWIDSICIDQANLEEKGQQVSMMGSIYKRASHVLACIGDHSDDSLFFFRTFYGLRRRLIPVESLFRQSSNTKCWGISTRFRLLHRYLTTTRFVLALAHLAVRPYFTRLWILQELQNAQNATILCGRDLLLRDDAIELFTAVFRAYEPYDEETERFSSLKSKDQICHDYFASRRVYRRYVNHGIPHPLWYRDWLRRVSGQANVTRTILRKDNIRPTNVSGCLFRLIKEVVCRLECADPRDKVYGIISLIDWGGVAPPSPDYTQSELQAAVGFLRAVAKLQKPGGPSYGNLHCFFIIAVRMLDLDFGSHGLVDALNARRGPPQDCGTGPTGPRDDELTPLRIRATAWQLLDEDIEANGPKLQSIQTSPPAYRSGTFFLPRWARAGDWAIVVESLQWARQMWYTECDPRNLPPTYTPCLIMRESERGEGHGNMLIGYGFYPSKSEMINPSFMRGREMRIRSGPVEDKGSVTYVDIYFDIEDGLMFLLRMKQLIELSRGPTPEDSNEWMVDILETAVCRHQTPWSSYATIVSEGE